MKEAENRFLILGSLGPGTCLAWRRMRTQFLSFALSVSAPSHPPSAMADMNIMQQCLMVIFYSQ